MGRRYIKGQWGQVHLLEAGHGPVLVLLHQSPLSGAMFAPALPLLAAAGLHAIALDTPGFGASDPPPAPASIADHADALASALPQLAQKPVHLLGHHTGAAIAAALAARHPGLVDRLILNGVPLFSAEDRAHFAGFRFDPITPRADGGHLIDAWHQRLRATPGWTDLAAMHRHVVTMLANPDRFFWGFDAAFAHDIAADLPAIRAPTLILTNSGEDLYQASCRAAALRPDWAFVALAGGTHDIVDEQPAAWATKIINYLN
jgi:pimeloyl-ACP methyl ester carboxylesterase